VVGADRGTGEVRALLAADQVADLVHRRPVPELDPGEGFRPGDRRPDHCLDRIRQEVERTEDPLELAVVVALVVVDALVEVALEAARWPGDEQPVPDLLGRAAVFRPDLGLCEALLPEHPVGIDERALEPALLEVEPTVDEDQQVIALARRGSREPAADLLRVLDQAVGEALDRRAFALGLAIHSRGRLPDQLELAALWEGECDRREVAAGRSRSPWSWPVRQRARLGAELRGRRLRTGLVGKPAARPRDPLGGDGELPPVRAAGSRRPPGRSGGGRSQRAPSARPAPAGRPSICSAPRQPQDVSGRAAARQFAPPCPQPPRGSAGAGSRFAPVRCGVTERPTCGEKPTPRGFSATKLARPGMDVCAAAFLCETMSAWSMDWRCPTRRNGIVGR
jgi:hypothetical protein